MTFLKFEASRPGTVVALVTVPEAMLVAGLRQVVVPQKLAARGGTPAPVAVRGDDIAFIQYTSGSTGSPKGVMLTRRSPRWT